MGWGRGKGGGGGVSGLAGVGVGGVARLTTKAVIESDTVGMSAPANLPNLLAKSVLAPPGT